jgi:DNA polymerase-3 subunit alpha
MRKIIGKKIPEKMKLEREKFVSGCVKNNTPESDATKLFDDIEGFSKYSFCRAHSIGYSVTSYQTAWLKTYYLKEFVCALLNNSTADQEDLVKYIYMCKEYEIPILPPDVNTSGIDFSLDNGTIIFGMTGLKGMGEKAGTDLISRRPEEGFTSLEHMVECGAKKNHIKALAKCGALEEISTIPREQLVEHLDELIDFYQKNIKYQARLKGIEESIEAIKRWELDSEGPRPRKKPAVNEKHIPVMPEITTSSEIVSDKLSYERQTLGFYLTGHPMDKFPGLSMQADISVNNIKSGTDRNGNTLNSSKVSIPAVISSVRKIRTKSGKDMASLMIEDKTNRIEAIVFPRQWKKLKSIINEDTVNIIKGSIQVTQMDDDRPPIVKVVVNFITPVSDDSAISIQPILTQLQDGTEINFIPPPNQNVSTWQQAVAIANNIKRMR